MHMWAGRFGRIKHWLRTTRRKRVQVSREHDGWLLPFPLASLHGSGGMCGEKDRDLLARLGKGCIVSDERVMTFYTAAIDESTYAQDRNWYLIQCKPRQDERAEENLAYQGYETLRPKRKYQKSIRGKQIWVIESLFPGYLFIFLPRESNWGPLRSTRGVSRVVNFGGAPVGVSDSLIRQLQSRAEIDVKLELNSGDNVRILEGIASELDAIFIAMDGEERVILLINLLNRQQQISVPIASIASKA
jgi:transcriptional antiterminator RfaH